MTALRESCVSQHQAFRGATAPVISATLMGAAVVTLDTVLPITLPLVIRSTSSVALGVVVYILALVILFRDHIADDFALMKAAISCSP